jgi:hypothetical protein
MPILIARKRQAFLDPSGLVPVVNEVEWLRRPRSHSTVASTDARSAGGSQAISDKGQAIIAVIRGQKIPHNSFLLTVHPRHAVTGSHTFQFCRRSLRLRR